MVLISNKGREVDETWRDVCSFCFVYSFKIYNRVLITETALTELLENTRNDSSKLKNMPDKRLGCPTKSLLKLVSAVFYQIFIFHQMIALQKLWKIFFQLKNYFCSPDIQIFVFVSSPLFLSVNHCFRGCSKINLKVYGVINCLNKNLITHFFDILRRKRYDF